MTRKAIKLSREQWAEIVEEWVNNPNISLQSIGDKYGVHLSSVSPIISKVWLYKIPTVSTEIIVKQSAINDGVAKIDERLELQLTA